MKAVADRSVGEYLNKIRIRRYKNRKLYDTVHFKYIQYKAIFDMIVNGVDFRVVDHIGKDITHWTIAQAIAKQTDMQEVKDALDTTVSMLRGQSKKKAKKQPLA
jgi:polyhydroxyalkanoate synthesis regulator protein